MPRGPGSIGFLHLSDLHQGIAAQAWLWPGFQEDFYDDLARLHARSGPIDLVLFTGDLTQRGAADELAALDVTLDGILAQLRRLGSDPLLLAVPGNHDLVRPRPDSAVVKALATWHKDRDVREAFWAREGGEYRDVVVQAFAPFSAWQERRMPAGVAELRRGLLPGDFSAAIERGGVRVGVVGLNSAFLQLTGGDYQGQLDLDVRQLHAATGGDAFAWAKANHATLLLTHHPPSWLHPEALAHFKAEIRKPGRFSAHLFGHMHLAASEAAAASGFPIQNALQAASLFGLETLGDGKEERLQGYAAGRVIVDGERGLLRLWPRALVATRAGVRHIVPDPEFHLVDEAYELPFEVKRAVAVAAPARAEASPVEAPHRPPTPAADAPLQPPRAGYDPAWYVHRDAVERAALQYLGTNGAAAVLWGPELFGKTWLLRHLADRLRAPGETRAEVLAVNLELLHHGARASLDEFLRGFAHQIVDAAGGDDRWVDEAWQRRPYPKNRLHWLMENRVLPPLATERVVLAIDRADAVLDCDFRDEFFGLLRAWAEDARGPWARLRLLLAVSTTPALLTETIYQSPFNLSPPLRLDDLAAPEVERLRDLYRLPWQAADLARLVDLVGGHPYLVRLAMFTGALERTPLDRLLDERAPEGRLFDGYLAHYRTRLRKHPELGEALAGVAAGGVLEAGSDVQYRLERAGLVRDVGGGAFRLRYRLYERLLGRG